MMRLFFKSFAGNLFTLDVFSLVEKQRKEESLERAVVLAYNDAVYHSDKKKKTK